MLYFATGNSEEIRDLMRKGILGHLITPASGRVAMEGYPIWAADNSCFGKGYPGDDGFIVWLEKLSPWAKNCYFANAPDVVGDAAATLARSKPMLPRIRELGYKVSFVAQNGIEKTQVPWDEFDTLFIGGTTHWKLSPSTAHLIDDAKTKGKWIHMGRVNSRKRFEFAKSIGCDSVDGTFLAFGPNSNLSQLVSWVRSYNPGYTPEYEGMETLF